MGFDHESRKLILLATLPLFILGIVEIVFGLEIFLFSANARFGAWWAGVGAAATFLSSYFAVDLSGKSCFALLVFLCGLICLVGTLVDGISYAIAGKIKACGNDNLKFWGHDNLYDNLVDTCDLPNGNFDCYCLTGANSMCLHFNSGDGFEKSDCEPLTDEYGRLLKISYSICLAMFFYCGPLFFFALGMCCRREKDQMLLDHSAPLPSSQGPIAYDYPPHSPQQQYNQGVAYTQATVLPPQYEPPSTVASAPPIMVVTLVTPSTSVLPSSPTPPPTNPAYHSTDDPIKYE